MGITGERRLYAILTADREDDSCPDIPDDACRQQPRNFLIHLVSLSATKTGDALMDPKLVLSWLLHGLGGPAYLAGWLVPVREAGALLPQLLLADRIRGLARRKWAWALGSLIQGVAAAGMALAAWRLEAAAAGWTILGCLAGFALARSVCSVSYKDVLGKTIMRQTRGTVTGSASTIAAAGGLLFGILLSLPWIDVLPALIAAALAIASGLWLLAAGLFSTLAEPPGHPGSKSEGLAGLFGRLDRDPQLVRFIIVRGLLLGTALAPPYLVSLSAKASDSRLGSLGPLVLASAVAPLVSSYIWGRLADRSSRRVLILAAAMAAAALGLTAGLANFAPETLRPWWVLPILLFGLMVAYQGVRLGRSTHLVDMADEDQRAAYTALSNTIIGVLLLAGGFFGLLSEVGGPEMVIGTFAALCAIAGWLAKGLSEVQKY